MDTEPPDPQEAGEVPAGKSPKSASNRCCEFGVMEARQRPGTEGVKMLGPEGAGRRVSGLAEDGLRVTRWRTAWSLGSEQGEGVAASRRAPSKRTPKGCCPVHGGPLWPPSGNRRRRTNEAGGQAGWGRSRGRRRLRGGEGWSGLCSCAAPQARQEAPLPREEAQDGWRPPTPGTAA